MTALKRANAKAPAKPAAAKKGAKAKAPAKAATGLVAGGVRFKGKVNQKHKANLKAKLSELAPKLLDAVNKGQGEKLSIVSSFQRPT